MNFLLVFLGSGLGGVLRYAIGHLFVAAGLSSLPLSTLSVNLLGAFAMGYLTEASRGALLQSPEHHLLLTTGLLGGFTTFSAFTLDTIWLKDRFGAIAAALYIAISVLMALFLFRVGQRIAC